MTTSIDPAQAYSSALSDYLAGAEESALVLAYEIGRAAVDEGLGVLDITSVYRDALRHALEGATSSEETAQRAETSVAFLSESLAVFEMVHRGYRATTAKLLESKEELERGAVALSSINEELQSEVAIRRQAVEDAHKARDEAEVANRAKSEFLSRMSHELRTPLNAIMGFSQLLQMDRLSEEQLDSVEQVLSASRHLLALIDEVLDISRIETGRLTLSLEPVHLGELLKEATDMVAPLAVARGIHVVTEIADIDESFVSADRQRLKQVLLNLLSNAVKYNRDGGSVTVSCRHTSDDRVSIHVADTGFGIADEITHRIFLPFDRLGAEATAVEGTGLGLALSKGLMDAMGGRIGLAESTLGVGTIFVLELPLADDPMERTAPGVRSPRSGAQVGVGLVLYIEDNMANLKLMERIFALRPQLELLSTTQGRLGVELALERQPNLVLLDLHLPDLAGRDVLTQLKGDPATSDIPVVVLTADVMTYRWRDLSEAGALGYLQKPVDVEELLRVIDNVIED